MTNYAITWQKLKDWIETLSNEQKLMQVKILDGEECCFNNVYFYGEHFPK